MMRLIPKLVVILFSALATFAIAQHFRVERVEANAGFWPSFQLIGSESEHYATLADMTEASDIVARGRFIDFKYSRMIETSTGEDAPHFGLATFQVTKALSPGTTAAVIPVEFLLPYSTRPIKEQIAAFKSGLPRDEVVVFLRDKGGEEAGLYRTVNSKGLWTARRGAIDAPLYADVEELGKPFGDELRGVASIDELVGVISKYEK